MELANRIFNLRKSVGLNQESFGKRIGVTRSAVCNYENGSRAIGEQIILAVCREFNVNEQWLRTGEGEMFVEKPESVLDELAKEYNLDELDRKMMTGYLKLNAGERVAIKQYMQNIIDNMKDDSPPAAPQIDPQSEIAELRRQMQNLTAKIATLEQEDELQKPWNDRDAG